MSKYDANMVRLMTSLAAGLAFACSVRAFDSWPQWRGPNRDGVSAEKGLLDSWEKPPLLVWKADGLGVGYAGTAVDRGVVCTMGNRGGKMLVIAVSDKDGKQVWSTDVGGSYRGAYPGSRCTPTIDGERVYALSPDGVLVCLKTATGRRVWERSLKRDFDGRIMSQFGYAESPLVDGDNLICSPGGPKAGVVALNKKTGAELWRCPISSDKETRFAGAPHSSIVAARGAGVKQYIQAMGEGLVGIEAETGKQLWIYNQRLGTCNVCTPIVRGDYVFAFIGWEVGSVLLKLTRRDGGVEAKEVYFIPAHRLRMWNGGAVLVGEYLYTNHQNMGCPKCIEFLTGRMMWPDGRGPAAGQAAVAYADGHLYYRYDKGVMILIAANPERYELKGKFQIPGPGYHSVAHPTISNGRLYVREQDALYCYDLRSQGSR